MELFSKILLFIVPPQLWNGIFAPGYNILDFLFSSSEEVELGNNVTHASERQHGVAPGND